MLDAYADEPVRTKDDGAPASPRRRRTYGEYAIKQQAVNEGLVEPIRADDVAAMRRAHSRDGMAWVACRTGLSHSTVRRRLNL